MEELHSRTCPGDIYKDLVMKRRIKARHALPLLRVNTQRRRHLKVLCSFAREICGMLGEMDIGKISNKEFPGYRAKRVRDSMP
jgi:hypothetical protein